MTTQARLSIADVELPNASRPLPDGWLGALKAHGLAWIETCADYYEAAAHYDQLSRLSDAELHRRGLSRASLARQVCAASAALLGR